MASPVMIDIPGVGTVEARNAATESTLRELVNALKGGGGGGAGAAGGVSGGAKSAAQNMLMVGESAKSAGSAMGSLAKGGIKLVTGSLGAVVKGAGMAAKGLVDVALSSAELINQMANVGDSLSNAANAVSGPLSKIPIVGGFLSAALKAVAEAAEATTGAFQNAASSGATFNGSVNEFSRAASGAGMTMKDFSNLIKSGGEGLLAFGGTTEAGAKRFADVSKQLRSTSNELYALGFSTQQINEGLMNYGKLLKAQGIQGNQTNQQMAQGAKNYLKELDALAKITGEERGQKEQQMMAAARDAQFQGAMANQSEAVRKSFLATLGGLAGGMQGPLGNFAKDILATGTATTEENQKLMAQMPKSAAMLAQMRSKMQRGEAVTEEERNALNNMMATEGQAASKRMGAAFAAAPEMAGTMNALTLATSMQKDAVKNATKEQIAAKEKTDKLNAAVEKNKAALAELSNSFQMVLANSGLLDLLMKAFGALASFMTAVVVPAFNIMSSIVQKVWFGMEMLLAPVIKSVSEMFGKGGLGGVLSIVNSTLNTVFNILNGVVRGGILAFEGLFDAVKSVLDPFKRLYDAIFTGSSAVSSFAETLVTVGDTIGGIFRFLGAVLGDVIDVFASVINSVKDFASKFEFLSNIASSLGRAFEEVRRIMSPEGWNVIKLTVKDFLTTYIADFFAQVGDSFASMMDAILVAIPNKLGGISSEEKKKRDEEREERKKAREDAAKQRKDELARANQAADQALQKRNEKVDQHKKEMRDDQKRFEEKKILGNKEIGQKKEELAEIKSVNKDYNDSLNLLKQEAQEQGSGFIKDPKTGTVASNAESSRRGIEKEAEDKRDAAVRKALEEDKPIPGQSMPSSSKSNQDSAESLLASLNNKMDLLIRTNMKYVEIADAQLGATKGLSKDLFRAI